MISPEWDEIVGERGAELSGAVWCDFERWSEHPRERGAEILTAQLRSHALVETARPESGVSDKGDKQNVQSRGKPLIYNI